jgi:hypothetical protein
MIFRNRLKDPKGMIPVGMICLVLAIVWPTFFHPTTNFGNGISDGLRGAMLGLSIGINLWSWRLARQRRCGGS